MIGQSRESAVQGVMFLPVTVGYSGLSARTGNFRLFSRSDSLHAASLSSPFHHSPVLPSLRLPDGESSILDGHPVPLGMSSIILRMPDAATRGAVGMVVCRRRSTSFPVIRCAYQCPVEHRQR